MQLQQIKMSQQKTPQCKGMIEFLAFNAPKIKTEPRLKGLCG